MRVEKNLWDKWWYFTIIATIFGNVIHSSTSCKCGALNAIRFKQKKKQLNKKEAPCKSLSTLLYAGRVHKKEKTPGKRYTNDVKYVETVSPA